MRWKSKQNMTSDHLLFHWILTYRLHHIASLCNILTGLFIGYFHSLLSGHDINTCNNGTWNWYRYLISRFISRSLVSLFFQRKKYVRLLPPGKTRNSWIFACFPAWLSTVYVSRGSIRKSLAECSSACSYVESK